MAESRFRLAISAQSYVNYYSGAARSVIVVAEDGRRIKFPAEHLRTHVTHHGVYGLFVLEYDDRQKFVGLRRISD